MHHKMSERIAGNTDTSLLKILALVFMFVDHLGVVIFSNYLEFRVFGRIAFPLYAWCLVVGSVNTRSPLKYGLRLLLTAAISQPFYMMALNHTWTDFSILFTLLIALIAIEGIRVHRLDEGGLWLEGPDLHSHPLYGQRESFRTGSRISGLCIVLGEWNQLHYNAVWMEDALSLLDRDRNGAVCLLPTSVHVLACSSFDFDPDEIWASTS